MVEEHVGTSGFLVVKTFERMCREYLALVPRYRPHILNRGGYSSPQRGNSARPDT